jgi:CubicO group peptidase (beta-lactamase class C family)
MGYDVVIVEGMSNVQAVFPLHSKPAYSNIAFTLLGYVVRKVTGLPFEAALKKHITVPLGMDRTTFTPISEESMVVAPNPDVLWSLDFGEHNP